MAEAIYPDPFSRRRVNVRDAGAAITEYRRSAGDLAGTMDLMLTLVEAGTEQAVVLGYGDEDYFASLENKLDAILKAFDELPVTARAITVAGLTRARDRTKNIGWGYGDFLDDVVRMLERRAEPRPRTGTVRP